MLKFLLKHAGGIEEMVSPEGVLHPVMEVLFGAILCSRSSDVSEAGHMLMVRYGVTVGRLRWFLINRDSQSS
jgi:hypothetical protein